LPRCPPVPAPRLGGGGVLVVTPSAETTPVLRIVRVEAHLHEGLAVCWVVVSDHSLTAFADDAEAVAFEDADAEACAVGVPVPLLCAVSAWCAEVAVGSGAALGAGGPLVSRWVVASGGFARLFGAGGHATSPAGAASYGSSTPLGDPSWLVWQRTARSCPRM